MENIEIFNQIPFHATFGRYSYLDLILKRDFQNTKDINVDHIIQILLKPPVLQNWRGIKNGDTITIWTYGLNLSTGKGKIIFAPVIDKSNIQEIV